MFFWIDLETTGLNEETCKIIEVACIATQGDFEPLDSINFIVNDAADIKDMLVPPLEMEPQAYELHKRSGLTKLLPDGKTTNGIGISLEQAEEELLAFMYRFEPRAKKSYLAGNSIHFDRKFLNKYMPSITEHLCSRHLDVSAIGLLFANLFAKDAEFREPSEHRALSDLERSIRQLKFYCNLIGFKYE